MRPPPREEPDWPPFPVELRREWHEMVAEEEQEEREREARERERPRKGAKEPQMRRCNA